MANSNTNTDWSTDSLTKATATTGTLNNVNISGDLTFSGTISGYIPYSTKVNFYDNDGDSVFIPFTTTTEDTTPTADSTQYRLVMPYTGYLEKIIFRSTGSADTCDFEIYKAVSGTSADDADQNKLSSTVSVEDGTANTTVTANFGTNYSFLAGDILAIKMTYESAPADVDMVVVWKILVD